MILSRLIAKLFGIGDFNPEKSEALVLCTLFEKAVGS